MTNANANAPPPTNYGKLVGGMIGTAIGIPLGIVVGRICGVEWPNVFDASTVAAVNGLVQGAVTLLAVYVTPHDAVTRGG